MTFASMVIALPLAAGLAGALSWVLIKLGLDRSLAALWAFCMAVLIGLAALLSDSPAGMLRAVWPREAVDWLALAAGLLTAVAALQSRPVALGRMTLTVGLLLGVLIVCRLLYGSVYLRPGQSSTVSLLAIALAGSVIGACWHIELARVAERRRVESLACAAVGLGVSATLGMSGSFQYAMIGILVTLSAVAAWLSARSWPWVNNLVILMLLGLGMAFAELNLLSMLALTGAMLLCSLPGSAIAIAVQASDELPKVRARASTLRLVAAMGLVAICVGANAQRFLKEVKGNNASHGGYEAYK